MNHARRRKNRTHSGVRTVELSRGKNGFGFTISGQAPCIFSCVVAGSPAEKAGLHPGDFLVAANGIDISRLPHDDVVRLIGNSIGVLRLQIAENYYSDSSSDDDLQKSKHPTRNRHRPIYRAEKVVRDLWTGALFADRMKVVDDISLSTKSKEPADLRSRKTCPQIDPVLRSVVGYLGTIEMPSFRLGAIGNCIRRLRIEKKVHTLVLLSVYPDGVLLTDPRGLALATFPADRIAFSGAYADDHDFFGLVTGSSCHVFLVDPKLRPHHSHLRQAKAFHLTCTAHRNFPDECQEFPDSADIILKAVNALFGNRAVDNSVSPQPSNSSSNGSNSDSGIGFRDEGNNSDRVVIVDMESHHSCRTNSLDRQNFNLLSPQRSQEGILVTRRDRLGCRAMPKSIPDKLSPKVFQGSGDDIRSSHLHSSMCRLPQPCIADRAVGKWVRTSSLRRHLPARKRSVRKTASTSEISGTMSDGELSDSLIPGRVGKWTSGFDQLLQDPVGLDAFTNFLKQEFSQENIRFWTACEQYRKMTDSQEMARKAEDIFGRHLCAGAPEPINVDSHARQVAQEGLAKPMPDIFLLAQKQIFNLMKFDCYQRFLKSRFFKGCLLREMQGHPLQTEEQERKHKSLLPWAKSKNKQKKKKWMDLEPERSDVGVLLDSSELKHCVEAGSLCRLVLPDKSTAVLRLQTDETVKEMVWKVLERRGLSYSAVDMFFAGARKPLDPDLKASNLACREIYVERRVLFCVKLPGNMGVVGIKGPPERSCKDVLRYVLLHFDLQPEQWVAHLIPYTHALDLSHPISTIDGCTLNFCTQQEQSGLQYLVQDTKGDSTQKLFQQLSNGQSNFRLGEIILLYPGQEENVLHDEEDKNPEGEDLLDIWKRAQRSRLDDQRGTEINFELPDFLKVASGKENRPLPVRLPPPLPPKSKGRGPPPRPPSRQPFCISFV